MANANAKGYGLILNLVREEALQHALLGKLWIGGTWQWFTLERNWAALPDGQYPVRIGRGKWMRPLPWIGDVPVRNLDTVRTWIYLTSDPINRQGVQLGGGVDLRTGTLLHSRQACDATHAAIQSALDLGAEAWIQVETRCKPWQPGSQVVVPAAFSPLSS